MKILFLFLLSTSVCWAQKKAYQYRAGTLVDGVPVYRNAHFDSPVIATLPGGKVYDVSSKTFNGAFYRIRVKPGVIGYVSDVDIKPLFPVAGKKNEGSKKSQQQPEKKEKKKRPFEFTRYGGLQYSLIEFTEDTMGDKRKDQIGFFGIKLSGPDLMVDGYFPTDVNILFHDGAPPYYEKLTGNSTEGWILLMDFLWESYFPHGKNSLTFLGFGPLFKFSRFNVSLTDPLTSTTTDYSLQDMSLGAVFNAGVALRWEPVALRGELQYYWEKQTYWGASLALQFDF